MCQEGSFAVGSLDSGSPEVVSRPRRGSADRGSASSDGSRDVVGGPVSTNVRVVDVDAPAPVVREELGSVAGMAATVLGSKVGAATQKGDFGSSMMGDEDRQAVPALSMLPPLPVVSDPVEVPAEVPCDEDYDVDEDALSANDEAVPTEEVIEPDPLDAERDCARSILEVLSVLDDDDFAACAAEHVEELLVDERNYCEGMIVEGMKAILEMLSVDLPESFPGMEICAEIGLDSRVLRIREILIAEAKTIHDDDDLARSLSMFLDDATGNADDVVRKLDDGELDRIAGVLVGGGGTLDLAVAGGYLAALFNYRGELPRHFDRNAGLRSSIPALLTRVKECVVAERSARLREEGILRVIDVLRQVPSERLLALAEKHEGVLSGFSPRNFASQVHKWFAFVLENGLIPAELSTFFDSGDQRVAASVKGLIFDLQSKVVQIKKAKEEGAERERAANVARVKGNIDAMFEDRDGYLGSVAESYADDMSGFDVAAFNKDTGRWVHVFTQLACMTESADVQVVLGERSLRQLACDILGDLKRKCDEVGRVKQVEASPKPVTPRDMQDRTRDRVHSAVGRGGSSTPPPTSTLHTAFKNRQQQRDVFQTMRSCGGMPLRDRDLIAWKAQVEAACDRVLSTLRAVVAGNVEAKQVYIAGLLRDSGEELPEALKFSAVTGQPLFPSSRRR